MTQFNKEYEKNLIIDMSWIELNVDMYIKINYILMIRSHNFFLWNSSDRKSFSCSETYPSNNFTIMGMN